MSTPLSALSNILSSGIATIESTYAKHGATFPSLNDPFQPGPLDDNGVLCDTVDDVIAAAVQLIALIKPVPNATVENGLSFFLPVCLQIVVTANIPEILREAGPQGLHAKDIGDKSGSDPQKIGRVLRYLATNHIFREVSPDVFANNRLSSAMDTGNSVAYIKANPINKYQNSSGIPATVGLCTDEIMKTSIHLADNLLDPKTAFSQELLDCAFSSAFGRVTYFDFLDNPENEYRSRRFAVAMQTNTANRETALVAGFDWNSLKQDALVVDVGGGVGFTTLQLIKAYPHLRYVVLDRPKIIDDGIKIWEHDEPEALKSGRVELKVHDFFEAPPIKDASAFILRNVLHDWPDLNAKKILKQLRASAQSGTKLFVCEYLVPYAAPSNNKFPDIPGAEVPPAPYPLLPNWGMVNNLPMLMDFLLLSGANAQERTLGQFIDLFDGTGWQLMSISRGSKNAMAVIILEPVIA